MVSIRVRTPDADVFARGLARIRDEVGVPGPFPTDALAEAADPAPDTVEREDARDLPLVTIDPPGSLDLDQAVGGSRRGRGYRVDYAIADVAAFVRPGGALDREARARGATLYLPDGRVPLHPDGLGEGSASLLPDRDRPAVLWTFDLDGFGVLEEVRVRRAMVRSRARLTYAEAQARLAAGADDENLLVLRAVGRARREREIERGAVSLDLPAQEVVAGDDGRFELRYDEHLPVEDWNAQVSLMTGLAAARIMLDGGVGILRTLPPPAPGVVDELRTHARALGVAWPDGVPHPFLVRSLDANVPAHAALLAAAVRLFRGAGYTAFRATPSEPPEHAAIAAPYSHVTAPLRRLVDRFAIELVLAAADGREPPGWAVDALDELPEVMEATTRRQRALERAVVDLVEAVVLRGRRGERLRAVVTARRGDGVVVQVTDPAVVTRVTADGLRPGDEIEVRVGDVDVDERRVELEVVG